MSLSRRLHSFSTLAVLLLFTLSVSFRRIHAVPAPANLLSDDLYRLPSEPCTAEITQVHLPHNHLLEHTLHRQAADTEPSTSNLPIIIGASVGGGVVILLLLIFTCIYYHRYRRAKSNHNLYYKFDYNNSSLASLPSEADSTRNHHPASTPDKVSIATDEQTNQSSQTSSKPDRRRKQKPKTSRNYKSTASYASMEDAISAPRTRPDEVPSAGVAFLDDFGKPIPSPL